jgi:hypothetical protein
VAPIFGDERLAIAIANIGGRATTLYVPQKGPLKFADQTKALGVAAETYDLTSFGLFFFDFDLDGRMDLFQSNGSIENQAQSELSRRPYLQPCQVFWNCGDTQKTRFALMPAERTGPDLERPIMGRGAAYGDIDGDADPDVLVLANGGQACLFRNDQRTGHHWVRLDLRGRGGNREAIGAKVSVVIGERTIVRQVAPCKSYLSCCELPLTFGLGDQDQVKRIDITWPGGTRQTLNDVRIDVVTVVEEPEPHQQP